MSSERLKNLDVHRREILQATAENLVDTVCVYRAGYIPQVLALFYY